MGRAKLFTMVGLSALVVWMTAVITTDVKAAETAKTEPAQSVEVVEVIAASGDDKKFNDVCGNNKYTRQQQEVAGCNDERTAGGVGTGLINVVLSIVGILAVIAIIIGAVQYITSNGDAGKAKKARDIIMYAVIGLIVALLAFTIVNFILKEVF